MSEYSIGIEDHYAWANLVSVTTSGADETLLDRRRVEFARPEIVRVSVSSRHPQDVDGGRREARSTVQASANRCAKSALSSPIKELAPATCRGVAIRVPPLSDWPATRIEIHASTWITNRADGMIYHHALTQAATQFDLPVLHFDKETVLERAAQCPRKDRSRSRASNESVQGDVRAAVAARVMSASAAAILAQASSAATTERRSGQEQTAPR